MSLIPTVAPVPVAGWVWSWGPQTTRPQAGRMRRCRGRKNRDSGDQLVMFDLTFTGLYPPGAFPAKGEEG